MRVDRSFFQTELLGLLPISPLVVFCTAFLICWWFVPAKSSVQFCSWRSYRFTCFVLSLSSLHCPALLGLLHSVSCYESWLLSFFTLRDSGEKLFLVLALLGTAQGTAFLHVSVAQAACWHHCSELGCQGQRKLVTRKSPLTNDMALWDSWVFSFPSRSEIN